MISGKRQGCGSRAGRSGKRGSLGRGRLLIPLVVALCVLPASPFPLHAQADLRARRDTLDRIRREREELERRAAQLQSSVHNLDEEVTNLDRRADVTARLVKGIDRQLAAINAEVGSASRKVKTAEAELADKKGALRERLVNIYKRGPMFATQAMLSARSFGELVARYKYLHLLALRDRSLVARVEELRTAVQREHDNLVVLQESIEENRSDKRREEVRLRTLERDRELSLAKAKRQVRVVQDRLVRIRATEVQLTNAIAALEAERRRAESARPPAARVGSTIKTSDYGSLDWPVDGALVYTFGKAQTASNTTIRWDGVGIKATVGTPVRVVAAGKVVNVGQLGTYGLTVIVDHGGGDYSIYGSLSHADVRNQQAVTKGQQIGTVGISDPELGPHLHFEIRHGTDGRPLAVDPAKWLKEQR
jgi:murein hydrolase activator